MEFLLSFLGRHFAGKPAVMAPRKDGCLIFFRLVLRSRPSPVTSVLSVTSVFRFVTDGAVLFYCRLFLVIISELFSSSKKRRRLR